MVKLEACSARGLAVSSLENDPIAKIQVFVFFLIFIVSACLKFKPVIEQFAHCSFFSGYYSFCKYIAC